MQVSPYRTHTRKLLGLGLPLVGANVAGFSIHMTDSLMLGWYSVTSLAAATVSGGLWFVTFIVGAGFGRAVTPVVAEAIEQGDDTRARRVTRMALWLSVAYAVLMIVPFMFAEQILLAMGQEAAVAAEGGLYLRVAILGMLPALCAQVIRSYLGALELTAIQMWITFAMVGANAVVNYALIFGHLGAPELGILGAAIASVVVQTLANAGVDCLCANQEATGAIVPPHLEKRQRGAGTSVPAWPAHRADLFCGRRAFHRVFDHDGVDWRG